ncbi:lipid II:glycine glycyltransferase FemX [Canibacter zhoujuaniae]|uniref:lipid II:glycine glycyltransferase FemX n=1 Tax=Canibacter zhoujuaniae TaxID=2708343 RepID=UPI00141EDD7B|nr:GNAT family N-acetyltransferase [Canibacter zhoujuaniae]
MTARWEIRSVNSREYANSAEKAGLNLPIEQTEHWGRVDEIQANRKHLGYYLVFFDGDLVAQFRATKMDWHATFFVWLRHGPVWLAKPSAELEKGFLETLEQFAKQEWQGALHLRLDLFHRAVHNSYMPYSLSTHDRTVVIDTTVSDRAAADEVLQEEIIAKFKSRGRKQARQSLRDTEIVCADETDAAFRDFSPYHRVLVETSNRDGFTAWSSQHYQEMLEALGKENARLYASRIDGELTSWMLVTLSGKYACYFYGASTTASMKRSVNERLVVFVCVDIAKRGCEAMDMMGIGSELNPSLNGLNVYKTKFSTAVVEVAPTQDVPLAVFRYRLMMAARATLQRLKQR